MSHISVDLDTIYNDKIADTVSMSDRRIISGFRLALMTMGIPLPDYAKLQKPGPRPKVADLAAAVDADTGTIYTRRHQKMRIGVYAPRF